MRRLAFLMLLGASAFGAGCADLLGADFERPDQAGSQPDVPGETPGSDEPSHEDDPLTADGGKPSRRDGGGDADLGGDDASADARPPDDASPGTDGGAVTDGSVPSPTGITSVAAGGGHTCVLVNGNIKCWGDNTSGQLGDGTTSSKTFPITVPALPSGVKNVIAGYTNTCALTNAGAVYCWGNGTDGAIGDGATTNRTSPTIVPALSANVKAIVAGNRHNCALLDSGAVQCWGYNLSGQLGDGTRTNRNVPTTVSGVTNVKQLFAAYDHTCVVHQNGLASCWGSNYDGELGDGTTTDRLAPTAVPGLTGVSFIGGGGGFSCAIVGSGGVKCWGTNLSSQLANNAYPRSVVPLDVPGITGANTLAFTYTSVCAKLASGSVKCWGGNYFGQLGNGNRNDSKAPVTPTSLGNVGAINGLQSHFCAANGASLSCWGKNDDAQLGTTSTTDCNGEACTLVPTKLVP